MRDTLRDELVAVTSDLIRFSSTDTQIAHIKAAMDYVAQYVDAIPDLYVDYSERNNKPAIVVTLHDTRTPRIMLNGHLDVVPAKVGQFEPVVLDGRIYGRASLDMKGSVAVLLHLLKTWAAHDSRPNIGIQFVSDEEIGGEDGTGRLLEEGWRCGCFVSLEPTDLGICYEQKGILWVKVKLSGVSAHGATPWEGRNPLTILSAGLDTLQCRFPLPHREKWRTTVTPTSVKSDSRAINQISSKVLLNLDIRYIPDDSPTQIMEAVQTCFPGAEIAILKRAPPLATSPETPMVQELGEAVKRVTRQAAVLYREHYGSDARFYSAAGIPAVCFGPSGAGMHGEEEWVSIESLVQVHDVLWNFVSR